MISRRVYDVRWGLMLKHVFQTPASIALWVGSIFTFALSSMKMVEQGQCWLQRTLRDSVKWAAMLRFLPSHTLLPTDIARSFYVPWNSRPRWSKLPAVNRGFQEKKKKYRGLAQDIFSEPAASHHCREIRCHNVSDLPNPREGWRESGVWLWGRKKKSLLCDIFDLDSGAEWQCGHSSRVWVDYTPVSPTATSQG